MQQPKPVRAVMERTATRLLRRVHRITHRMPLQLRRIERGARVLVVAPHCDDEAVAVGGCLALHHRLGSDVTTVFVTSDRPTAHGVVRRGQEAERAADLLGFKCLFLHIPHGKVSLHEPGVSRRLADILRATEPEVIFCPFPGDHHRDHQAAATSTDRAVIEARFGGKLWCYETWSSLWPNCGIDISDVVDAKRAAIECYQSRLGMPLYVEAVLGLNRYRGLRLGVAFAEGFFVCGPPRFHSLCMALARM